MMTVEGYGFEHAKPNSKGKPLKPRAARFSEKDA
jgi:hypothetical protein